MRTMKDVQTMSIPCSRSISSPGHGHETAAVLADLIVRASRQSLVPGRFGIGVLKDNGFHGDKADMFYIHPPEHSMRDWWDDKTDTFVPMQTYCTNSTFVRFTRTGSRQCKCHGHPLDKVEPDLEDPLRYADGTAASTRVKVKDFLKDMMSTTDGLRRDIPPAVSHLLIGFDQSTGQIRAPPNERILATTQKLCRFAWSKVRQPITGLLVTFGHNSVKGTDVTTYFTGWKPTSIQVSNGRQPTREALPRLNSL